MAYAIRKDDENLTLHSVKHSNGFLLSWGCWEFEDTKGLSLQGLQGKQIVPVTFFLLYRTMVKVDGLLFTKPHIVFLRALLSQKAWDL